MDPDQLTAALNALPCDVALVAGDGTLLFVNDSWNRRACVHGSALTRGEAGCNYFATLERSAPDVDAQQVIAGIRSVCAAQREQFCFDYAVPVGSQQCWFQMIVTPCKVSGGAGASLTHWCIDSYKQTEEDLRSLHGKKDQFFATLLHELRNPLAPIASAAELLGVTDDPRILSSARGIIQRQLRQLTRLVDDLLDVSRIARGSVEMQMDTVDIGRVLASAVETARPLIKLREHHFSMTVPPTQVLVEADATRLNQVFTNLLLNAARYTEPGGNICVTLECTANEAVVRVRDNGIGISREMLPRVFDLFAQGAPRFIGSRSGLGVGLTLARQLLELHHGSISVHSDGPGQGSEFTVRLPLRAATRKEQRALGERGERSGDEDSSDPHDAFVPERMLL